MTELDNIKFVGKVKDLDIFIADYESYIRAYPTCPYLSYAEECCKNIASRAVWINPHTSTIICPCERCVKDLQNGDRFKGLCDLLCKEDRDRLALRLAKEEF